MAGTSIEWTAGDGGSPGRVWNPTSGGRGKGTQWATWPQVLRLREFPAAR